MSAISCASLRILNEFGTQGLSNTVWAFSTLPIFDFPLMESIASAAIAKIEVFQAQELANTSWAFSAFRLLHAPLLEAISAASMAKINSGMLDSTKKASLSAHDSCTPLHLSITAWSYAAIGCSDWPLLHAIAAAARHQIT